MAELGDWVTVLTTLPTLPLPSNAERPVVETERLVLRAIDETDLDALHALRGRPPTMRFTRRGVVDKDMDATRERLQDYLSPNDVDSFNYAICLRGGSNRLIGVGGVHHFCSAMGWPEIGYMLHDDCWGKGYATEFLRAFLRIYEALPRPQPHTPVPLRVTRDMLSADAIAALAAGETPVVDEVLTGVVADANTGSQKVILKGGFEEAFCRTEPEWSNPESKILLHFYQYRPSRAASGTG